MCCRTWPLHGAVDSSWLSEHQLKTAYSSLRSALGGIPNEALAGIMGEIELLRGLNHPNIVKYIGSFKTRSHLYIIMEVGLTTRTTMIARHSH